MKVLNDLLEVKTTTNQLTDDTAADSADSNAGTTAYKTFLGKDVEISSEKFIPYHAIDHIKVKHSKSEAEVEDDTCVTEDEPTPPTPTPHFTGLTNASVAQGLGFDLTAGVKAYDGAGNEIPFTVSPTELDACDIGHQSFTYTAEGVTAVRTITVTAISDPTISGLTPLEVEVNEEFDPLDGVSAVDGNGKSVEVTVEQPSEYPYTMCTIGAGTIPGLQNGGTETIAPGINWLNIPPSDGKQRELKVYGENVDVMGESLSNPVGDGSIYGNNWSFSLSTASNYYTYEDMALGSTEINAVCYGDGHETGTESWDSLRIEVIGEM